MRENFAAWVRRKIEDIEKALEQSPASSFDNGSMAFLLKTATRAAYPTAAGRFYWCEICKVSAAPTEGAAGTAAGTGQFVYAYNLGGAIPPVGTLVVGTQAGPNYAFRFDS
jgi:hypothetical protein